jgi:hypothetical protein
LGCLLDYLTLHYMSRIAEGSPRETMLHFRK